MDYRNQQRAGNMENKNKTDRKQNTGRNEKEKKQ